MKTIVIYYSNKGSNSYLAHKISESLSCETEEIKPRLNIFLLLLMNISMGIKPIHAKLKDYDRIILCGPVWMGKFIAPLRGFIKKYETSIKQLVFVTCCGSSEAQKDEKSGYGLVFKELQGIVSKKCVFCQAFPISLVMPDDKKNDGDTMMKTHLNDENFKGEIEVKFQRFINKLNEFNTI